MRRTVAALCLVIVAAIGIAPVALATTHQATVGNYYYEDNQQRDRTKIVVRTGDQITFTVRQAAYPPHTVDVDELEIHSPDLLVGQTFTTPRLDRVGTFRLYCRPHEARGHYTQLVVRSAPAATAKPAPTVRPAATQAPVGAATPLPSASTSPPASPASTPTLAPVGVGTAPPGALDRPLPVDPDSVQGLTGVRRSNTYPWTRAVYWLLLTAIPIVAIAIAALIRDARRRRESG